MSGFFGIHHASLLVADTRRALGFYEDVLGMKQAARPPLGFAGAWLAVGEAQQIHLLELPSPDADRGRPDHGGRDRHVALLVKDLGAIRERLARAGIAFTESKSGRKALFCRDPDANALELIEKQEPEA